VAWGASPTLAPMSPETPGPAEPSDPTISDDDRPAERPDPRPKPRPNPSDRPAGGPGPSPAPAVPAATSVTEPRPADWPDAGAATATRPPAGAGTVAPPTPDAGVLTNGRPRFRGSVEQVDELTPGPVVPPAGPASHLPVAATGARTGRVRARKVRRIVRHIDPWSVLKISVLFFLAVFLIVCVASAVLWNAARSAGTIDDVESFITSVGGFGNCEPVDGGDSSTTPTTAPGATTTAPVNQLGGGDTSTSVPPVVEGPVDPDDDEDCPAGTVLTGAFKFEDGRIFQAFALGGIVLVLAGAATAVVLTLLFNVISDLTGGVRVTVIEEDPVARPRAPAGSPGPTSRG